MRDIIAAAGGGDDRAQLAIEVFCYRLRKYIGAYTAVLGRVDGLIFTGGIGENSPFIRGKSCEQLSELGFVLDLARNREVIGTEGTISAPSGRTHIMVISTNEELLIARDTCCVVRGLPPLC